MIRMLLLCVTLALGACADGIEVEHDPEDFEVEADGKADGISAVFDMHEVMDDLLFVAGEAMDATALQEFFEHSPYKNRSWLASHAIEGVPASEFIVAVAREHAIHPLVLVARMQVETSLVSKTAPPAQRLIDRALGCGCPDGGGCNQSFKGIGPQLRCGARTLRRWFDASSDGTGAWRQGVTKRTLDPKSVTPRNHATASLYAYTPWVLVGRGGTWLAWNVTRKYVRHAELEGLLAPLE
jgi:hypothetical protein